MSAIGRAPIENTSRMIPPTPVAAPWYGSTADGWLWLSMRTATARPSPMSTTPAPSPGPTRTQAASVEGRNHARTVGRYLEAIEANRPRRGRRRTADGVKKRLAVIGDDLNAAGGLQRLTLLQERRDLEVELAGMQAGSPDLSAL